MTCPNCHQEINPGASFCGNCGRQLATSSQPPQNTILAQPAQSNVMPYPPVPTVPGPTSPITGIPSASPTFPPGPQPQAAEWYNGETSGSQPSSEPSQSGVATPPSQPSMPLPQLQPATGQIEGPSINNSAATPVQFNTPPVLAESQQSTKAIAAFVLGIVGCVGWLIPIVGVTLGILAIVFGTISLKSPRRVLAIIGMVLAVPVIAISIFFWVKGTQQYLKTHSSSTGSSTAATATPLQVITSPCYSTKIPAALQVTQTAGSCTFNAADAVSGDTYQVKVLRAPQLTKENLSQVAKADAQNVVNVIPGGSIASQNNSVFASSPAYTISLKATDGSKGVIDYIYQTTTYGNLVIVYHALRSANSVDFRTIESNWAWK